MQIPGLLGMYFDAVVVKVKTFLLLFKLALVILWCVTHRNLELKLLAGCLELYTIVSTIETPLRQSA